MPRPSSAHPTPRPIPWPASPVLAETGLILLVALLVEMGGLGPFVTMSLAKVPKPKKISVGVPTTPDPASQPDHTAPGETHRIEQPTGTSSSTAPRLIYSAAN